MSTDSLYRLCRSLYCFWWCYKNYFIFFVFYSFFNQYPGYLNSKIWLMFYLRRFLSSFNNLCPFYYDDLLRYDTEKLFDNLLYPLFAVEGIFIFLECIWSMFEVIWDSFYLSSLFNWLKEFGDRFLITIWELLPEESWWLSRNFWVSSSTPATA